MGRTSIPCSNETRDKLNQLRNELGMKWDPFLLKLARSHSNEGDNSQEFNEVLDELESIHGTIERVPADTAEKLRGELP